MKCLYFYRFHRVSVGRHRNRRGERAGPPSTGGCSSSTAAARVATAAPSPAPANRRRHRRRPTSSTPTAIWPCWLRRRWPVATPSPTAGPESQHSNNNPSSVIETRPPKSRYAPHWTIVKVNRWKMKPAVENRIKNTNTRQIMRRVTTQSWI